MTTTPPEAPHGPGPQSDDDRPRPTAEQLRDVARLSRTVGPYRKVAGVAGGLARHFDVDPVILRVAFVVLALFGGGGILIYLALWLLLPDDEGSPATINLDPRNLSVALIIVGVIAGLALLGNTWSSYHVPWPLLLFGLLVALVVMNRQPRQPSSGPGPVAPTPPPYPSGQPGFPPGPAADATTPYAATSAAPTTEHPMTNTDAPTTYAPSYAPPPPASPPPAPPYGWQQPGGPMPAPFVPPPTRRRGPILFWFTLALITLALGVLGMVDVGGTDVPLSAYPALATAIAGVMLLVGSFYGRAGGIILLGLMGFFTLGVTSVADNVETTSFNARPTTAAAVATTYSEGVGEVVIDLSDVRDPAALDGRTISVESGVGHVLVIVPPQTDVIAKATVGAGDVQVFGAQNDGLGVEMTKSHDVFGEVATINLDVQLGLGQIEIQAA
jgi:phage shock protein PspC (stress-responsive transcriptional regulator)